MQELFKVQLLLSFLAGGGAVTLLSFIAERANHRTAGIILSLPTNLAVSLFFIGWTLSPGAVAEAAVGIPASLGASMLFTAVYVFIAKRMSGKKVIAMVSAFGGGLTVWIVLALPLAVLNIQNVFLSIIVYALFTSIAHVLLTREAVDRADENIFRYTGLQKLWRALFSGSVIMLIVFLSKTLGPLWGGVFSVFPAAISSVLLILHWQRDANIVAKVSRTIPLGSPIFLVYTLIASLAFPAFGLILGTVIAYGMSFVVLWLYLRLLKRA